MNMQLYLAGVIPQKRPHERLSAPTPRIAAFPLLKGKNQ
jgi:hypothetical protein